MSFFNQLPEVHSERIRLRALQLSDAADVFEFTSKPETTEFLSWPPHTSADITRNFIQSVLDKYMHNEPAQWAIELRETGKVIGITGFIDHYPDHARAEIAFVMSPDQQGKGLMTEANSMVLKAGFTMLQLNRIQAKAELDNIASQKVLEKIGMQKEGVMRDYIRLKGSFRSYILYAALKADLAG